MGDKLLSFLKNLLKSMDILNYYDTKIRYRIQIHNYFNTAV
jgi:hypothetical protein